MTSEASGRRVTAPAIRAQAVRPAGRGRRRSARGRRPRSIRSPSSASIAGSTVSEPSTAIATTSIVARPIEMNTALPESSSPASATITVRPETRIARPTVADAASSAAAGPRPARRSSRSRRM